MGKTLDRPFRDSGGFRGASFATRTSQQIASIKRQPIQFELSTDKHILLRIPGLDKPFRITQKNAIKLSYWILDNCQSNTLKP